MTDTTLAQRREQLTDIMKDAAKGETKATLREDIALTALVDDVLLKDGEA